MKLRTTIILCLFLIASTTLLQAHDWYDVACCSGNDCHPVPCEELIESGKSIFYKGWEFFGGNIKPSKDALCHVCISNEFSQEFTPVPHCVYIQNNS